MTVCFEVDGRVLTVAVLSEGGAPPTVDGEPVACNLVQVRPSLYSLLVGGRSYEVVLDAPASGGTELRAHVAGREVALEVVDERQRALRALAGGRTAAAGAAEVVVRAPMPGRVVAVPVSAGDAVERGQTVVVLEAMKMESAIGAPHPGTIAEVLVAAGVTVQQRQALIRIESRA